MRHPAAAAAAAAVMAAGLFEFTKPWKRDYVPVFGERMPYWTSNVYSYSAVSSRSLARRNMEMRRNEIATRLRAFIIAIHSFNCMTLSMRYKTGLLKRRFVNERDRRRWMNLSSFRATREIVKNNAMMNLTERDITRDTDGN